ncbi:MAG: hypothetical protein R3B07_18835 [Polyangiaceae bacterium]
MLGVVLSPKPARGEPHRQDEAAPGLTSLDARLGVIDYTENSFERTDLAGDWVYENHPFVTRGSWLELDGQFRVFSWLALAGVARFGWLERGPPATSEYPLAHPEDRPLLDPQLGDSHLGGSVAPIVRFLPGSVALDAGFTYSIESFRPRLTSAFSTTNEGYFATGYAGYDWWPTVRVSSTWEGVQFAIGTGEGFIHANEPTMFELLLGYRGQDVLFLGGISRGLSLRFDTRLLELQDQSGLWLSTCLGFKPWGPSAQGEHTGRSLFTAGVSWRMAGVPAL